MLVFIDDSGDPSFTKLGKKSSEHFVIACIIFDDNLEAEKVALAIKQLRRDLKFRDTMEFKFNGSRPGVRKSFLQTTLPFNYRVRAIVVNKSRIHSEELRNSRDSFYNYTIKSVLKNSRDTLSKARVRLDGHGDRIFRRNLASYLRKELNTRGQKIVENIKLVDSKSNVLIQMADMIAGSIRRSYDKSRSDNQDYRKIIADKIQDCWEFK